jgi:serine/threonine protein kinase
MFIVKPADRGKKDALEGLKREIAILKKVDHPNVVKLHEVQIQFIIIYYNKIV